MLPKVLADRDRWIVIVTYAPGYSGFGEPIGGFDMGYTVLFNASNEVTEILTPIRSIKPATQPR